MECWAGLAFVEEEVHGVGGPRAEQRRNFGGAEVGSVFSGERYDLHNMRQPCALGDQLVHERQDQAVVELRVIQDGDRG